MAQTEATVLQAVSSTTSSSSRARLALAVFAATAVACALAAGLDLHSGNHKPLVYVGLAAALGGIGFVLTSRMPRHRISWVMAGGALWWAVGALSNAWAVEALVVNPGSLPGGVGAAWFDSWAWLPGLTVFASALLVLMPDGHLASRRWWPVLAATAGGCALLVPAISTAATFDLAGTKVANPWSTNSRALEVAVGVGVPLVIAGLVASLAAFAVRYRRSEGDSKRQLGWVGASLGLSVVLGVAGAFLWGVVPGASVLPALAVVALPAGIAVAVLRYRLYELDLVVNRTLVYLVLTVAVVGSYVIVVGLVGSYLSRRGDLVVSVALTGVVAVGFQPLRARVQRWVNRLMYGERDDPYLAIAGLGRSLAGSLRVDAVLPTAVETIGRTLALQYVGVAVAKPGSESQEVASFGAPATEVLVFPLVHQRVATGELRLSPRPGERLRERDRRLIVDLAPQVAAAAHAVELAHDLQTARRRLVTLQEEERRRIRRDLHDGLGPALAGLTFTIDAARNLAPSDLAEADELLASAGEQTQTLIADVRRLIYGLRPPTLDELGLIASLRPLVSRVSSPRTRLVVDAPDPLPQLEAAVEVSAYRIVQEALTNVSRHAHATNCTIQLALEPMALLIEVSDDGCGFTEHRIGVGLNAMRERAAELGGTCEIVSAPGAGTTVSVRLPRETAEAPV
jgi:signal transduction histidine kinase